MADSWTVVVPQKDPRRAKSRLDLPSAVRTAMATAMLADTLDAVLGCDVVREVVLVTDNNATADALYGTGVVTLVCARAGQNAAVTAGEAIARQHERAGHVAVVPGDLPSLQSADLRRALQLAAAEARSFVRDATGNGTTLLAATRGAALLPAYGPGSADQHARSGAVELAGPGELVTLREDVDDLDDLLRAIGRGVGASTQRLAHLILRDELLAGAAQ